jgi:hypothetical protein
VIDYLPFSKVDCQNITTVTHSTRSNQTNSGHSQTPHCWASICVSRHNAKVATVNCNKSNFGGEEIRFLHTHLLHWRIWSGQTAGHDNYTSWNLPQYRFVGPRMISSSFKSIKGPFLSVFKPKIIYPPAYFLYRLSYRCRNKQEFRTC